MLRLLHRPLLLCCIALAAPSLMSSSSRAAAPDRADEAAALAARAAALRAEIEALAVEVDDERQQGRDAVQAATRTAREREDELARAALQHKQLQALLAERQAAAATARGDDEALQPVFAASLQQLTKHIESGLPFRRADRLAAAQEVEREARPGAYARALTRLWGLIDDELRLAHETALSRQPVMLDSAEHLADVARVGMVSLYFRVQGSADRPAVVGAYRVQPDGSWRAVVEDDAAKRALIEDFFGALSRQVVAGPVTLPAALPAPAATTTTATPTVTP